MTATSAVRMPGIRPAARRTAALAALALALLLPLGAAAADAAGTVYLGILPSQRNTAIVKFVFSDPARPDVFAPVWGLTLAPDSTQCNIARAETLGLPEEYARAPVYEPSNPMLRLTPEAIPVFFEETVSAALARKGYATEGAAALPYRMCTRRLWQRLIAGQ